jgi:hypothetical protein
VIKGSEDTAAASKKLRFQMIGDKWRYSELPHVFSSDNKAETYVVQTSNELQNVLDASHSEMVFVESVMDKYDAPIDLIVGGHALADSDYGVPGPQAVPDSQIPMPARFKIAHWCETVPQIEKSASGAIASWRWISTETFRVRLRTTFSDQSKLPVDCPTRRAISGEKAPKAGYFEAGTTAAAWFRFVNDYDYRNVIFIEQAITLGRFGVLTFLFPEEQYPLFKER